MAESLCILSPIPFVCIPIYCPGSTHRPHNFCQHFRFRKEYALAHAADAPNPALSLLALAGRHRRALRPARRPPARRFPQPLPVDGLLEVHRRRLVWQSRHRALRPRLLVCSRRFQPLRRAARSACPRTRSLPLHRSQPGRRTPPGARHLCAESAPCLPHPAHPGFADRCPLRRHPASHQRLSLRLQSSRHP